MSIIHSIFRTFFKIVETLTPNIAKKWAVNLFFTPMRFKRPVHEQEFVKRAKITKVKLELNPTELYNLEYAKGRVLNKHFNQAKEKSHYTLYELGEGPVVLLVHGWSGRASQLGTMALKLAESGYKTVTFDAFAHGNSPGKQTTVFEFVKIIKDIYQQFGPFEAIIAHSLGGIAAGKAIIEGIESNKLITIGSPTTFNFILDSFCKIINASKSIKEYILSFTQNYAKSNEEEFSLTNIGEKLDLPGLIIHDKEDREAEFNQALLFDKNWSQGNLISTKGLGHTRILRDEKILDKIIEFVKTKRRIIEVI